MSEFLIDLILIIVWFIMATLIYPWFVKHKIVSLYGDKKFVEGNLKLSHDILMGRLTEAIGELISGRIRAELGRNEVGLGPERISAIKDELKESLRNSLNGFFGQMVNQGNLIVEDVEDGAEVNLASAPTPAGSPIIPPHARKLLGKYGEKYPLGTAVLEILMANGGGNGGGNAFTQSRPPGGRVL